MAKEAARFLVSPRLAVLLGESYRSVEQALKELVDNAWDADAPTVEISLPSILSSDAGIVILDTGEGMSLRQVKDEYLRIARDRRKDRGARTANLKRAVKGRKGVGKFAGIIVAEVMTVETKRHGTLSKFTIDRRKLEEAAGDIDSIDVPVDVSACPEHETGTKITLTHLSQSINFPTADSLRHALASDYGRESNFAIFVNETLLDHLQVAGHNAVDVLAVPGGGAVRAEFTIAEKKLPKAMQGIVVKVMEKIVGGPRFFGLDQDESVPPRLLQQITGVLHADCLENEAARMGWTDLNESEKKVQAVFQVARHYLKEQLHFVFQRQMAAAHARFMKKYLARLRDLPEHKREFAKEEILRIVTRYLGNDERAIEAIEFMLTGLERDDYWTVIKALIDAREGDIASIAAALSSFGVVDLAMVARSAKARLVSLDAMRALVADTATLEASMHNVIQANLWLFGSEYAMLSSNAALRTVIPKVLGSRLDDSSEENRRPDLLLLNHYKEKHLLIEFKRPIVSINWNDKAQAERYRALLLPHVSPIEIMVIGGKRIKDMPREPDGGTIRMATYTELISKADGELRWLLHNLGDPRN